MGLSLQQQAGALVLGVVFGLGMGLLYDLIRPLRRRAGRFGWAFDAVYVLASGLALFVLGMCLPTGRLGLWELLAAIIGFTAYMSLLSPFIFPVFDGCFAVVGLPFKKIRKYIGKVLNFIFQKGK